MNYTLIHNESELNNFINFLPDLNPNEGYFLILIARKKWFPESGIPSAHKLKRETVGDKSKIIQTIKQWEIAEGGYTSNGIPIDIRNLGVYMGFNPKNQYKACFELINECLEAIKSNNENINVKSMANDVIQGSHGTKNFMDIDVDIKEGEDYLEIKKYIESVINPEYLKFIKTNGGFHCLVQLKKEVCSFMGGSEYENSVIDCTKQSDFSVNKNWYMQLKDHPFKSELNIMSNDLIPLAGCNQGLFVPYFLD
jgi:hypothetical protein